MKSWKIIVRTLLLGACVLQSTFGFAQTHRYTVEVADDLSSVSVTAELGDDATRLKARNGERGELQNLRTCAGTRLRAGRGEIRLAEHRCVRYDYPLRNEDGRRGMPTLAGGVVVSSPSSWLWLPALGSRGIAEVELELPDGVTASLPWKPMTDNRFEIVGTPQTSRSNAIFGRFREATIDLPGGQIRAALIDSMSGRLDHDKTLRWLETAAMDVAGVSGRFPNPAVQVIVLPVAAERDGWGDPDGSPVPFGHVIRDQGESVRYFVSTEHSLAAYLDDWTATHEFSHLLLPYVEQKWVAEGFASYYQNVLLARRGAYSETEVWQRLSRSFASAAATRNPPTLNGTRDRSFWEVRMLVYWSGAAIALMADVELRRLSDGAESLDTSLSRLQNCCLPARRSWSARRLFEKLDGLSEYTVFVPLYERYANARGMPDLAPLYRRLGIQNPGRRARLSNDAPLAEIRQQLMQPTTGVSSTSTATSTMRSVSPGTSTAVSTR